MTSGGLGPIFPITISPMATMTLRLKFHTWVLISYGAYQIIFLNNVLEIESGTYYYMLAPVVGPPPLRIRPLITNPLTSCFLQKREAQYNEGLVQGWHSLLTLTYTLAVYKTLPIMGNRILQMVMIGNVYYHQTCSQRSR